MLELRQVTKTYSGSQGNVTAVEEASLGVGERELVAVQGPSGCGKTTLLLMCGALLRPTQGAVSVVGADPYELTADQRSAFRARNIGFVFQQFHLVPYLSVLHNVLTPSVPHRLPDSRERAQELIQHFRLEHRTHHVPSELSVGERQRVALSGPVEEGPD